VATSRSERRFPFTGLAMQLSAERNQLGAAFPRDPQSLSNPHLT
jgi:hypothetical protein